METSRNPSIAPQPCPRLAGSDNHGGRETRWRRTALAIAVALGCWSCDSQPYAGTGSQSGNSVVAGRIALAGSDTAPANVDVYLRPLRWTSGQSATIGGLQRTTTDASGNYLFQDVPPDVYRIEADRAHLGWSKTIRASSDTNHAPLGILVAKGRVRIKFHFLEPIRGGRVEFYGLDRFVDIPESSSGELRLEIGDLPVGLQTMRLHLPQYAQVYCQSPLRIGPDSTSVIEYEDVDHVDRGPAEDP